MLAFHTARIGFSGAGGLDISRKSGGPLGLCFAPSWDLLKPYLDKRKAGALTDQDWQEYRRRFLEEMRQSYQHHRRAWQELLGQRHAVLCCYCDRYPCHRFLVAWCLLQMGAEYLGELDKDGTKPEHVAIVGSRPPKDDAGPGEHETWARRIVPAVTAAVRALPGNVVLVSGGAPGGNGRFRGKTDHQKGEPTTEARSSERVRGGSLARGCG